MYLCALGEGEQGKVLKVSEEAEIKTRFRELGIIEGTPITCLRKSPLGDPVAYKIRGAVIAIRNADAKNISIEKEG